MLHSRWVKRNNPNVWVVFVLLRYRVGVTQVGLFMGILCRLLERAVLNAIELKHFFSLCTFYIFDKIISVLYIVQFYAEQHTGVRVTLSLIVSQSVPFQAVTRHHGDYSVMGTPSLQPFLKTYWLTPVNDWPIVAKHANMTSSRGSINAAPATIRQNLFLHLAEPRLWLKMVQLTVKVRSFEGRPHGCSSAAFRWVWHFLR